MGQPCCENPRSYEAVEKVKFIRKMIKIPTINYKIKVTLYTALITIHPHTVLLINRFSIQVHKHILQQTDVGDRREWTVIGCDGLPFTLASRIIGNFLMKRWRVFNE